MNIVEKIDDGAVNVFERTSDKIKAVYLGDLEIEQIYWAQYPEWIGVQGSEADYTREKFDKRVNRGELHIQTVVGVMTIFWVNATNHLEFRVMYDRPEICSRFLPNDR